MAKNLGMELLEQEVPLMRNLLRETGEVLGNLLSITDALAVLPGVPSDWEQVETLLKKIEDGGYV